METQRDRWEKSPTPPESLDASITRFLRGNFRGNLVSKKNVLLKLKHIFDDPWFPKKKVQTSKTKTGKKESVLKFLSERAEI